MVIKKNTFLSFILCLALSLPRSKNTAFSPSYLLTSLFPTLPPLRIMSTRVKQSVYVCIRQFTTNGRPLLIVSANHHTHAEDTHASPPHNVTPRTAHAFLSFSFFFTLFSLLFSLLALTLSFDHPSSRSRGRETETDRETGEH